VRSVAEGGGGAEGSGGCGEETWGQYSWKMLRVAWSVSVLAERDTMRRKAVCSSPVLARRARKNLEEQHPHRSFAPGVRTQDQLDCEVKGGAPSTGAVGSTRVSFLRSPTSKLWASITSSMRAVGD